MVSMTFLRIDLTQLPNVSELGKCDLIRCTLVPLVKLGHPDVFDLSQHRTGPIIITVVKLDHSDLLNLTKGTEAFYAK